MQMYGPLVLVDDVMGKDIAISARGVRGSIPGPVQSDTVANGLSLLRRFCVAQALCRGDGLHYSSLTLA